MARERSSRAGGGGDGRDAAARATAAAALDELMETFEPIERAMLLDGLMNEASNDPALRRALEAEARADGRLRRRAFAVMALAERAPDALGSMANAGLVTECVLRQTELLYVDTLLADGPAREMRKEFVERGVRDQIRTLEALTESDPLPPPGVVALLAWLKESASSPIVRREAAAALAGQEDRDWRSEALAALQEGDSEQAARAFELVWRHDPKRAPALGRGLCLLAAGDRAEGIELLDLFRRERPDHPLGPAVAATCAWARETDGADADDEEDGRPPVPLGLPFLVGDPVADLIERSAPDARSGIVRRVLWGFALVMAGERLEDVGWDVRAWADAVERLEEYLTEAQGGHLSPNARELADPRVALLALSLGLVGNPSEWFPRLVLALDVEGERDAASFDGPGQDDGDGEAEILPAWVDELADAFMDQAEPSRDFANLAMFVRGLLRSLALAQRQPERMDDVDLCQTLTEFAVFLGASAAEDASDPGVNVESAVEWALRLAAFLRATQGAPVDPVRVEAYRDELTELLHRLVEANRVAVRETAAARELGSVEGPAGLFAVDRVASGRVWLRPQESGRVLTITTKLGLERWLRPGDVLVAALERSRSGRYALSEIERVVALPRAALPPA